MVAPVLASVEIFSRSPADAAEWSSEQPPRRLLSIEGNIPKTETQLRHLKPFLERDAPYNPLCTHYSGNNSSNNNNNNSNVVSHSTNYTFYRVTY